MNRIQCLLFRAGLVSPFARLKAHHERSLYRLTQKRGPQNACWVKKRPFGGRAKSPFPSRSREGSYPTVVAGRACRLPRFTHCDFGLCTLVCHLVFLLCHVSKCHLHGLETCMLYILTYNGYMLHMIHETMNMNYVTWTKLICKMNIDRMYMKMTSKYMTYLYKYYVPGTATITITMQCTNTLPRSNVKQRTSTNPWTRMKMPILTSNVLFMKML